MHWDSHAENHTVLILCALPGLAAPTCEGAFGGAADGIE
jgi:hypothetical protein